MHETASVDELEPSPVPSAVALRPSRRRTQDARQCAAIRRVRLPQPVTAVALKHTTCSMRTSILARLGAKVLLDERRAALVVVELIRVGWIGAEEGKGCRRW